MIDEASESLLNSVLEGKTMYWILSILVVVMIAYVGKYTRLHTVDNDPDERESVKSHNR